MKRIVNLFCLFHLLLSAHAQLNAYSCPDANGQPFKISTEVAISSYYISVTHIGTEIFTTTLPYTNVVNTICLPGTLKSNRCIKDILCKNFPKGEPGESLAWLNDIKRNKVYGDNAHLDFSSKFLLRPVAELHLPLQAYHCDLNDSCTVLFAGNNIGSQLKEAGSDSDRILYTLKNAVVVKQNGRYSWLFISDGDITDSYNKLRFDAIRSAKWVNGLVVIERNNTLDGDVSIFIIDCTAGTLKCYQNLPAQDYYSGYSVVNNNSLKLILHDGGSRIIDL